MRWYTKQPLQAKPFYCTRKYNRSTKKGFICSHQANTIGLVAPYLHCSNGHQRTSLVTDNINDTAMQTKTTVWISSQPILHDFMPILWFKVGLARGEREQHLYIYTWDHKQKPIRWGKPAGGGLAKQHQKHHIHQKVTTSVACLHLVFQ